MAGYNYDKALSFVSWCSHFCDINSWQRFCKASVNYMKMMMMMKAHVKTFSHVYGKYLHDVNHAWYYRRRCFCIGCNVGENLLLVALRFRKYPFTDTKCCKRKIVFLWLKQILTFFKLTKLLTFRVLAAMPVFLKITRFIITDSPLLRLKFSRIYSENNLSWVTCR